MTDTDSNTIRGITLVPRPSGDQLDEKERVDYRAHRRELIKWCLGKGKNPRRGEGYSIDTVRVRAGHIDRFYRWVWSEKGRYTTAVDHDTADGYMDHLAFDREDLQGSTKAKSQKSLKMLWKWRSDRYGDDEWDPSMVFSEPSQSSPREYLTRDERTRVREAALNMGSIPHYKSVSPDEREKWKQYIAVVTEKPLREIGRDEWEELTGWKETSLIHTSLDAGLRPIEVRRARTGWFDRDNQVLRIPREESSKNKDNWIVALRPETAEALERWIIERENYPKYEGRDDLWLTRRGNPYSSSSLKGVLNRACEKAGIDTDHRNLTWYACRHSVGTYLTREEGLAAAQAQLRHRSINTTVKYDNVPVEDRRDALGRM